jgi:hypothetical protein
MPVYYLIVGNRITQEIDTADTDVVALPILDSARAVSLLNRQHIIALMNNTGWTAQQVIDRLGLIDERDI